MKDQNERVLGFAELWEEYGLSRRTIGILERAGRFPERVGRSDGPPEWLESDVQEWRRLWKSGRGVEQGGGRELAVGQADIVEALRSAYYAGARDAIRYFVETAVEDVMTAGEWSEETVGNDIDRVLSAIDDLRKRHVSVADQVGKELEEFDDEELEDEPYLVVPTCLEEAFLIVQGEGEVESLRGGGA